MKIINQKPPIWEDAHRHFEIDDSATVYTYGDAIYNPAGIGIPQEIVEHESVHAMQQKKIGGPDVWWKKYFTDPAFRYEQEVEAYGRQHAFYCYKVKDRNQRAKHLHLLATILSSPMYKVEKSQQEASALIKNKSLLPYNFK